MKKIFLLILILFCSASLFAQNNTWNSVAYTYSKGPVSPEYQYSYTITIYNDGNGSMVYRKGQDSSSNDFRISKKQKKSLNKALNSSNVFAVTPEQMKSETTTVGGPSKSIIITTTDIDNAQITVPSQVKPEYAEGIDELYNEIENLVPASIWQTVTK